jgi:hypothetical protein
MALSGCNKQPINPSAQPPSQVFAGHYVDNNPYDPVNYVRIPTQSGQGFRFDVGHRSDLIPATIPK